MIHHRVIVVSSWQHLIGGALLILLPAGSSFSSSLPSCPFLTPSCICSVIVPLSSSHFPALLLSHSFMHSLLLTPTPPPSPPSCILLPLCLTFLPSLLLLTPPSLTHQSLTPPPLTPPPSSPHSSTPHSSPLIPPPLTPPPSSPPSSPTFFTLLVEQGHSACGGVEGRGVLHWKSVQKVLPCSQ